MELRDWRQICSTEANSFTSVEMVGVWVPWGWAFPSPPGRGKFFGSVISKWHILVNSEVINLKFSLSRAPSVRFGSTLCKILDFRAKPWIKDIIKCCHWARTSNIGLLYPTVRNNIGGDIPTDVPSNQNIGGDVSPVSPAGLTPVRRRKKCLARTMDVPFACRSQLPTEGPRITQHSTPISLTMSESVASNESQPRVSHTCVYAYSHRCNKISSNSDSLQADTQQFTYRWWR